MKDRKKLLNYFGPLLLVLLSQQLERHILHPIGEIREALSKVQCYTHQLAYGGSTFLISALRSKHIGQAQVLPYTVEAQLVGLSCGAYIKILLQLLPGVPCGRELLYLYRGGLGVAEGI